MDVKRIVAFVALAVSGVLLLLVVAIASAPLWERKWAPPDNGVGLVPQRPILLAKDVQPGSAFDLLRRATEAESRAERTAEFSKELKRLNIEPWSDAAFPALAKMLDQSGEALQLAREAADRPEPQVPSFLKISDPLFPYLSPLSNLSTMFRASAARMVATGDLAGAMRELESGIRFVQILTRGGVLVTC